MGKDGQYPVITPYSLLLDMKRRRSDVVIVKSEERNRGKWLVGWYKISSQGEMVWYEQRDCTRENRT